MHRHFLIRPDPFFNRVAELAALGRAYQAKNPAGQALLLYGRRRLGKTYLLQRFFAGTPSEAHRPHCYFLADQTTATAQRLSLAEQLLDAFPEAGVAPAEIAVSWNALLRFFGAQATPAQNQNAPRPTLILDEFPYLVQQTPELPSILQAWWDREGVHSRLMLVLCGSQLSVMRALGAQSAPLYGRFTAGVLEIAPLRYDDMAAFYQNSPQYDRSQILIMYGVFGGTPRYHALVETDRPFGEEIVNLLLRPGGALENEAAFLLGSEQIRDPAPYNAVLAAIARGETQFGGILNASGAERGSLSYYLSALMELGWVEREFPFEETSERRALYKVSDPFVAFWYGFVRPLASAVSFDDPQAVYDAHIAPRLADYMGRYALERICHQWLRRHGAATLGESIAGAGRWWSRDGQTELDILARLHSGAYLLGECKWSANRPLGTDVYGQLLAKAARLPDAKWRHEPRLILFSVSGFTTELQTMAVNADNRLYLVGPHALLPPSPTGKANEKPKRKRDENTKGER